MYKVMIIDDEPIIVEGLSKSIDWEKYNCQVVATAHNGREGKKLIEEIRPDMVFLDICMPEMDGLTMVAALQSEYKDMLVTVLTGFRDFEYAQRALHLGVCRFLLKPSNMTELEEAISYMVGRLDARDSYGKMDAHGATGEKSEAKGETPEDTGNALEAAGNFIVRNAIAYMEAHYAEKIYLNDVAEQIYVSQWHLSKLLNKELGQNFSEVLNGIRIKKAEELLKDPSLRIGDIAEEVGFLDVAHFSRIFKKITGVSANEYRNRAN
ncbi:MAG: response regulator [Lachnospiraceae bacterium]|nr:response regulator [Lachnospiraceae bacterium]